jgi:prepilin-type N-terminal cleavage/methylation domain-containing protein
MRLTTGTLRARRDAGFTLIELLVTVAILGVITAPLSNVVIGVIQNAGATSDRLALSHDAQISAAYFGQDVAGAGMRNYAGTPDANGNLPTLASIQLNAAYNAGGKTCGTPATPAAVVRFLSDVWDSSASPPSLGTDIVAYYLSGTELHRMKCLNSAAATSDVVIAHYVDPASVDPASTPVVCAGPSTCGGAAVPAQVTLSFTVTKPSADAYPITLTGQRRQT